MVNPKRYYLERVYRGSHIGKLERPWKSLLDPWVIPLSSGTYIKGNLETLALNLYWLFDGDQNN